MGRGRQKAKDAKVARQLKYTALGTDLQALERELVSGSSVPTVAAKPDEVDEYYDRWADENS